jgi:hypothetical protein
MWYALPIVQNKIRKKRREEKGGDSPCVGKVTSKQKRFIH